MQPRTLRCLLASVALSLAFAGPLRSQEGILIQTGEVTFIGERSFRNEASHLLKIYPEAKNELDNVLGWKLRSKPNVLLIGDKEIFEKMSGSAFISAFALPSRHFIVLYLAPLTSKPYILNETFKHELCHLVLHDHIREPVLPKWLDEGVCQWVSGSLGEIFAGEGVDTSGIEIARRPIPLRELSVSFPHDKDSLLQAYAESRRFVDYLTSRYGKESLHDILNHLKEGGSIDQAIAKTVGKSLDQVEEEWLRDIQGMSTWLIWASQHLYDILFFIGGVLTILASVRLWARKRNIAEEDE